jgi:multidrug efflux pump subunit AcrA (membrane-fusion protein)
LLLLESSGCWICSQATRANGADANNIVHFREVEISTTEGGVVRIGKGLQAGEKVLVNVPDEISDGSHIQPVALVRN